jgi:mono/diheme cytochrome c family protein
MRKVILSIALLSITSLSLGAPITQQLLEGKKLYKSRCIMCHGFDARATGPLAKKSTPPTPDLTTCYYQNKLAQGAVVSSVVLMPAGMLIPDTLKKNGIKMPPKVWTDIELRALNKYVLSLMPKNSNCHLK